MKLLTEEIKRRLTAAYQSGDSRKVIVKFFVPWGAGTWYIIDGFEVEETGDWMLFGWANLGDDDMAEYGYTALSQLQSIIGPGGLRIERDLHLPDCTVEEAIARRY